MISTEFLRAGADDHPFEFSLRSRCTAIMAGLQTLADTVEKVCGVASARNNRIMIADFVNRSCAFDARFESILLATPSQNPFSTASGGSCRPVQAEDCEAPPSAEAPTTQIKCAIANLDGYTLSHHFGETPLIAEIASQNYPSFTCDTWTFLEGEMATILYARVSTAEQTIEHQRAHAEDAGFTASAPAGSPLIR